MLIDSHCHLHLIDLTEFDNDMSQVIAKASEDDVEHFLSVSVELDDYPRLCKVADIYPNVSISIGVHPNNEIEQEPDAQTIAGLANQHLACIAIGETGLDYYRCETEEAKNNQKNRFRNHIHAALDCKKPLIIHTRQAANDTLALLQDENAESIGGVMHCFTEDWEIAEKALALNFYISISGIVTFKNATVVQEVAKKVPLDRLLIETDSPYLAPVPFRGKQNHPALVKQVALAISELRQVSYQEIARHTTNNFYRCFNLDKKN